MQKRNALLSVFLMIFLLAACNLPMQMPAAQSPTSAAATGAPANVVGETPEAPVAATEKAVAIPTEETLVSPPTAAPVTSGPDCVTPQNTPTLDVSAYTGLPQSILNFLNAGGTAEALDTALNEAVFGNQPKASASGDLDGDGKTDVAVSIFDPASQSVPPAGVMDIYTCHEGAYQVAYELPSFNNYGAPSIRYFQDINADGKADLVISQAICGASTCVEAVQILVWNGSGLENRLVGSTEDLPYPDIQIEDPNGSGIYNLVVLGGSAASVGAGPQRGKNRTWSYDSTSGQWTVSSEELEPSDYRIHVLQDADDTLTRSDTTTALVVYQWVISDQPPLQDYMDPANEKMNLSAYAYFRIAAIHAKLGEIDQANAAIATMESNYPSGSPQFAFVEMAKGYVDAMVKGNETMACNTVQTYASQHTSEILDPLGSKVYGYSNKDYTPAEMCP